MRTRAAAFGLSSWFIHNTNSQQELLFFQLRESPVHLTENRHTGPLSVNRREQICVLYRRLVDNCEEAWEDGHTMDEPEIIEESFLGALFDDILTHLTGATSAPHTARHLERGKNPENWTQGKRRAADDDIQVLTILG